MVRRSCCDSMRILSSQTPRSPTPSFCSTVSPAPSLWRRNFPQGSGRGGEDRDSTSPSCGRSSDRRSLQPRANTCRTRKRCQQCQHFPAPDIAPATTGRTVRVPGANSVACVETRQRCPEASVRNARASESQHSTHCRGAAWWKQIPPASIARQDKARVSVMAPDCGRRVSVSADSWRWWG